MSREHAFNYPLIERAANFLAARAPDDIARRQAGKLRDAATHRSTIIGKRLEVAIDAVGLPLTEWQTEFNDDELADLFTMIGRTYDPNYDYTRASRQRQRRAQLNKIAAAAGYDTWSKLETAALNGEMITLNAHE